MMGIDDSVRALYDRVGRDLAGRPLDAADVVLSNCVVNTVSDKPAGGELVVADVVVDTGMSPGRLQALRDGGGPCFRGALPVDAYLAALTAAGLSRVEVVQRRPVAAGTCEASLCGLADAAEALALTIRAVSGRTR